MTVPKRDRVVVPVSIPSGTSLSLEVNVGSMEIVGIQMPAGWDAAGIAFMAETREASGNPKVTTFGFVQDQAAAAVNITGPVLDSYVSIAPATSQLLRALGRIKVRSGTNAVPVNQTAQRDFFLVCLT